MNRISWKKGMRLTAELLTTSDNCTAELVGHALSLAAAGRFGLLPSATHPFQIDVSFTTATIDVERLTCLAITRSGQLIDIDYDTRFNNTFTTQVPLPQNSPEKAFLLCATIDPTTWHETTDASQDTNSYIPLQQPAYGFVLVAENTPTPDNAMPIARIVNEFGWRLDDINFVPPCLYVSAHQRYTEQARQFADLLTTCEAKAKTAATATQATGSAAMKMFWPMAAQLLIANHTGYELLTPMSLQAGIQQLISAFACACNLDPSLNLADSETYHSYAHAPYSYKKAYLRIGEGLRLCTDICEKLERMQNTAPPNNQPAPAAIMPPSIDPAQLVKRCTNSKTRIPIINNTPDSTVYYTTDGSQPTTSSKAGNSITIETGFNNTRMREPDKQFTVKLIAVLNDNSSPVATFQITVQKDIERWSGISI